MITEIEEEFVLVEMTLVIGTPFISYEVDVIAAPGDPVRLEDAEDETPLVEKGVLSVILDIVEVVTLPPDDSTVLVLLSSTSVETASGFELVTALDSLLAKRLLDGPSLEDAPVEAVEFDGPAVGWPGRAEALDDDWSLVTAPV